MQTNHSIWEINSVGTRSHVKTSKSISQVARIMETLASVFQPNTIIIGLPRLLFHRFHIEMVASANLEEALVRIFSTTSVVRMNK